MVVLGCYATGVLSLLFHDVALLLCDTGGPLRPSQGTGVAVRDHAGLSSAF